MVFLYNPWIPRGDDKMGHYVHYIGGGIVDSKIYETGNAAKMSLILRCTLIR